MSHDVPRGIEHIGICVPDHDAAVRFFESAFGATVLQSHVTRDQPLSSRQLNQSHGMAARSEICAASLLRFGNAANIEIMQLTRYTRLDPADFSDMGLQHFSVYVDDLDACTRRFVRAGGLLLDGPFDLIGYEAGAGNRGRFGRMPWGSMVEFITLPAAATKTEVSMQTRWFPQLQE
ncbi:MAG: VOC family protein [Acidobacteriaceae bacterium]|nr:VOC family protein [Acidobacteriaceae bacterium]